MNVAAGFTTGFSFNHANINDAGSVSVYSGLSGTGTLLATLAIPITTTGPGCETTYDAGFCPFVADGISFSGTAESVSFAGVENQIVFDDVTFGSSTPGGVPEPAALTLLTTALHGPRRDATAQKRPRKQLIICGKKTRKPPSGFRESETSDFERRLKAVEVDYAAQRHGAAGFGYLP